MWICIERSSCTKRKKRKGKTALDQMLLTFQSLYLKNVCLKNCIERLFRMWIQISVEKRILDNLYFSLIKTQKEASSISVPRNQKSQNWKKGSILKLKMKNYSTAMTKSWLKQPKSLLSRNSKLSELSAKSRRMLYRFYFPSSPNNFLPSKIKSV